MDPQNETPLDLKFSQSRTELSQRGFLPVVNTTPQANLVGKAVMALAKMPVRLELPAGAMLFLALGLIMFGLSLRPRA